MYEEVPDSNPWTAGGHANVLPLSGLGFGVWSLREGGSSLTLCDRSRDLLGERDGTPSLAHWVERVHPADRPRLEGELATVLAGLSGGFECTYRVQRPEGGTHWIRTKGATMRSEDGNLDTESGVHGVHEDVSDRMRAERKVRQAEARFRALVEGSPDGVAVVRDGHLVYGNDRLADLLGTTRFAETPLLKWVHPEDRSAAAEALRGALKGDSGHPLALRIERVEGSELEVELGAVSLDYEGGPALCVVLRDVTERKELQLRLDRSNRMASLGTLAAGVAHEINNPLTFITANLQGLEEDLPELVDQVKRLMGLISRDVGPQQATRWFRQAGLEDLEAPADRLLARTRDAVEGAIRVRDIVQDLDTYARVDPGRPGRVELSRAIELAQTMCRHELKRGVAIDIDLGDLPPVFGEEGRLSQVFLNLIVNAAQAGAQLIQLRARPTAEEIVVEVTDDGPGMPPEVLDRIFEPFFTTKEPGRGTGLGLAITREIVAGYGGSLDAASQPGRGTTVRVCLPISLEEEDETVIDEAPVPIDDRGEIRRRILLIDDERQLVDAYAMLLEKDYEVLTACTGQDALERLQEPGIFDAVICDLIMPDLDGMGIHAWLEVNRPELVDRLIWMTGGAVGQQAKDFLEESPNLVLKKPVDIHHLRGLLKGLLSRPL